MAAFREVAKLDRLGDGMSLCVEVDGRRIALFNIGGKLSALDDECPHAGGSLSEGTVEGQEVECPWHGARFKLETGEVTAPPAFEGVRSYPARINGTSIEVEV